MGVTFHVKTCFARLIYNCIVRYIITCVARLVEILQPPNFRRLCVIHCHRKLITSLKWHPAFTGDSSQLSPCNYWLASASYESVICVIDLKTILGTLFTILLAHISIVTCCVISVITDLVSKV